MKVLTIKDAYLVDSRSKMRQYILFKAHNVNEEKIWDSRSLEGCVREWCGHNFLYNHGLFKARTKDVDLEFEPKWYMSCVWWVLSLCYGKFNS